MTVLAAPQRDRTSSVQTISLRSMCRKMYRRCHATVVISIAGGTKGRRSTHACVPAPALGLLWLFACLSMRPLGLLWLFACLSMGRMASRAINCERGPLFFSHSCPSSQASPFGRHPSSLYRSFFFFLTRSYGESAVVACLMVTVLIIKRPLTAKILL